MVEFTGGLSQAAIRGLAGQVPEAITAKVESMRAELEAAAETLQRRGRAYTQALETVGLVVGADEMSEGGDVIWAVAHELGWGDLGWVTDLEWFWKQKALRV